MKFDFNTYTKDFIDADEIKKYALKTSEIKKKFEAGLEELTWFQMTDYVKDEELREILTLAKMVREESDIFLIVGIGGSYMGAKAMLHALRPYFQDTLPEIIFVGNSLSSDYLNDLMRHLKDKRVSVNVISKSGNTMETILTFQHIYAFMREKYSKRELRKRLFITTNHHGGKLWQLAETNKYPRFIIPEAIGGRFCIFTPVVLFPMAVAGLDIMKFLQGGKEGRMYLSYASIYAMVRHILFEKEKTVEAFSVYEDKLRYVIEWMKQLFAETEGKECQGILPITVFHTQDLHALGQFIQEGNPIIFETILEVENTSTVALKKYHSSMNEINHLVRTKVCEAHMTTGCPSNLITLERIDAKTMGELSMFMMMSAAISGYLFGINPFDQPGVSKYKELVAQSLRTL